MPTDPRADMVVQITTDPAQADQVVTVVGDQVLTATAGDVGKVVTVDADGTLILAAAAGGVTDHGALTGLADNDHPQYALDAEVTAAVAAEAALARNADNLTGGTVADARIAGTIARDSEVAAAVATSEAGQVRDGDAAGGVLSGTYPSPGFAADMATQAELDAVAAAKADKASPALTGTPTAPTAAQGTNTTQLATTAYVQTEAGLLVPKSLYDANSILIATADNTPIALPVGASTFLGRKVSGDVSAMSVAEAGALLGAYTDFVPTFTQSGALTTSSLTARYNQIGKRVHFAGRCTFSNAGTGNNPIRMTLPVAMLSALGSDTGCVGNGMFTDGGTALYGFNALAVSTTSVEFYVNTVTAGLPLGQNPNMAVANNDQLRWDFTYEAA